VSVYEAGRTFSELPDDRHAVSANASKTQPAKLLAVLVVDTNETELTIPFGNCAANHVLCQTVLFRCGNHANTGSGSGPSRAAAHIQAFCDRCRCDAGR
jgi:hypothetical protein